MSKMYPIEKSPLYRMRNRRKLAVLLGLPKEYFHIKGNMSIMNFRSQSRMEMEKDILLSQQKN